jgi:hypothetical protein
MSFKQRGSGKLDVIVSRFRSSCVLYHSQKRVTFQCSTREKSCELYVLRSQFEAGTLELWESMRM